MNRTRYYRPAAPIGRLLIYILFACSWLGIRATYAQSVYLKSVTSGGGIGYSNSQNGDITTDASGNVFATGYFYSSVTLGTGQPGEVTLTTSSGDADLFLVKYAPDGSVLWARQEGGAFSQSGQSITLGTDGSLYVSGSYYQSATFGMDASNETTLSGSPEGSYFIARYTQDGVFQWAQGSTTGAGIGVALAMDPSNAVYLTGYFTGTLTFNEGKPGQQQVTSTVDMGFDEEGNTFDYYTEDIFLARYNPDGTLSWVRRAGGPGYDRPKDVAFGAGSVFVTGGFSRTAVFGPGETSQTSLTAAGPDGGTQYDVFVARFSTSGNLQWVKRAGGSQGDLGNGVAVTSQGYVYVTGGFTGTAVFGPGESRQTTLAPAAGNLSNKAFVARYQSDGKLVWARQVDGSGWSGGMEIGLDPQGNPYVTGTFIYAAVFGPGEASSVTLTSEGGSDVFVARYSPKGNPVWVRREGGSREDAGARLDVRAVDTFHLLGFYQGNTRYGKGEPYETVLTAAAGAQRDFVLASYAPPTVNNGQLILAGFDADQGAAGSIGDLYEHVSIRHTGETVVSLGTSTSLVFFQGNPLKVSYALTLNGLMGPDGTLLAGNPAVKPEVTFPNGTLPNGPAAVAIVNRPKAQLANGTFLSNVMADAVTIVYYQADQDVTDYFHRLPELEELYCEIYGPNASGSCDASARLEAAKQTTAVMEKLDDSGEMPQAVALEPNYPNPFNPQTTIGFTLPESGNVRLVVFDLTGREITRLVDGTLNAGHHEAVFDASRLPSGAYIYRLEAGAFVQARTMMLVK